MNNTDKLLRAALDSGVFDTKREVQLKVDPLKYSKLDESLYRHQFTTLMVKNIIEVLGNHTVARNGHNNDDVLELINNLEAMIDANL